MRINSTPTISAVAGLSLLSAAQIKAAQPLSNSPRVTLESTANLNAEHQSRAQLAWENFTATTYYQTGDDLPKDFTSGVRYKTEQFKFDMATRDHANQRDLRFSSKINLSPKLSFGATVVQDAKGVQSVGLMESQITENLRLEGQADNYQSFRARTLLDLNKYQASLTLGADRGHARIAGSVNAEKVWLAGDYSKQLGLGLRMVIGQIDHERSRKIEASEWPGRNEIARFQNIHDAQAGLGLGTTPEFRFAGRSFEPFLASTPGSWAVFTDYRENARAMSELAIRMPNFAGLKMPHIGFGATYDFRSDAAGMAFETGAHISGAQIRVRIEKSIGKQVTAGVYLRKSFGGK